MKVRKGSTLLEMMIVLSVFTIVAVSVYEVIHHMTVANLHMSAQNDLTDWSDSAINALKDDLMQSRLMYENDATGNGYMAACAFPPGALPLTGSRLPVIDETGQFVPDVAAAQKTGNALLFARCLEPYVGTIPGTAPPVRRAVDLYRFAAYYLTRIPGRPIGNRPDSLSVTAWESVRYADVGQINQIAVLAERQEIVRQLVAQGIDYAWDFSKTADQAFFLMDGTTGDVSAVAENPHTIAEQSDRKLIASLGLGFASVAWNPSPTWSVPDRVPQYGIADVAGDGFPHGFEVQVIGPAGARQVLMRMIVTKFVPLGSRLSSQEMTVIATSREF